MRFNRVNTAECRGESGKFGNQRNGDENKSRQGTFGVPSGIKGASGSFWEMNQDVGKT